MSDAVEDAARILLQVQREAQASEAAFATLAADPAAAFGRHGLVLSAEAAVDIHRARNGHVFIGVDLRDLTLDGASLQPDPATETDAHDRHFSDCYFAAGGRSS